MNNTYQTGLLKALIIIVGLATSLQSAQLTYEFLNELQESLGRVGLLAEAFKFLLPVCALFAIRNNKIPTAVTLSLITLLLAALSFTASYVAVENALLDDSKQSAMYEAMTAEIDSLNREAASKRKEASALAYPKWKTKISKLEDEAFKNETKAIQILKERANLKSVSTVHEYSKAICLSVALILELLTLATSIALFSFTPRTTVKNTVVEPENTVAQPSDSKALEVLTDSVENAVIFPDKYQFVKTAIISGATEPSVRGIQRKHNGIGREVIGRILTELREADVLEDYRNGYRLARRKTILSEVK